MATKKSTGYQAAATSIAWTSGQAINSLTDNEWTDLSDEIDNTSNLYQKVDLFIDLASAAFTGEDSWLEVYVVPSVDGTAYPNWTGNVTTDEQENYQYLVGHGITSGATEQQEIAIRNIEVPPGKYKWGFRSRLNVSAAASGNVIKWRPHNDQIV